MQILLIGSNGQVASKLKNEFSQQKYNLTCLSSQQLNLEDSNTIIPVLENYERRIGNSDSPKIIINAAAYTNVEQAESEEDRVFRINAIAPGLIAKFAKDNNYLFVNYSTDYVFDGEKSGEYKENDQTNPLNIYGKSKLEGENRIREIAGNYLILRTSWVFSEIGVNFIKKITELLLSKENINVISDQTGRPTYAGFIASVTIELIKNYSSNFSEIINICQPETTSWHHLAIEVRNNLLKLGRKTANISPISSSEYKTKAMRPQNSTLSIGKLNHYLPNYSITSWESDVGGVVKKLLGTND